MEFDHLELFVPDPLEAVDWYAEVLGFEIIEEHYHWYEEGGPLMITNDGGQTMIALFEGPSQETAPVVGFRRAAFRLPADEFIEFIQTSGRWRDKLLGRPEIEDHDQSISVYFEDPYGNLLEVTTYQTTGIRDQLGLGETTE